MATRVKVSIIVPFLNSHEIVRRQVLHFRKMRLPDDVEILYMDDGSDPPLTAQDPPRNFRIIPTHDTRPWTSSLARNLGAKLARGTYLLMTDGDYILSRELIESVRKFSGDRLGFRRQFGVLDEDGNFTQDPNVLMAYGLPADRIREKGMKLPPHPNNFAIRAELFWQMGGYREDLILTRPYPQGEDRHFKRVWINFVRSGRAKENETDIRPTIYMFPNGQFCGDVDYNPFGLFHTLTRKTPQNHWYMHPRYAHGDDTERSEVHRAETAAG